MIRQAGRRYLPISGILKRRKTIHGRGSPSITKWKPCSDADRRQKASRRQGGKQHYVASRRSGSDLRKRQEDARNHRRNRRYGKFHYHHRPGMVFGFAPAPAG